VKEKKKGSGGYGPKYWANYSQPGLFGWQSSTRAEGDLRPPRPFFFMMPTWQEQFINQLQANYTQQASMRSEDSNGL
jgi:hypothetical protein